MPVNQSTTGDTPSAGQIAVDWANRHMIDMARIEAAQVENVKALLTKLESSLTTELLESGIKPGKAEKLKTLQEAAAKAIGKTYSGIESQMELALEDVAGLQAKQQGKQLNAQIGVDVFGPVLTEKQWSAVANETLIFGHKSGDWWASQSESLRFKFAGAMQEGYARGESVDELVRRVRGTKAAGFTDGIMQGSRREAEALVRSSVQTISNAARLKGYEELVKAGIAKGVKWHATLDGRTTPICQALNGLEWRLPDYQPVGHGKEFPGPTAHWNCRSTQVAVLRSWDEMSGKKIPQLDNQTLQAAVDKKLLARGMSPDKIVKARVRTQASMNGPVPKQLDFQKWLETQPDDFALELLGPGRFALWKAGKITTRDLTDQQNRPLTIAQLEAAIEGGTLAPETEGVEYLPPAVKLPKFKVPDTATDHHAANGGTVPSAITQAEWLASLTDEQKAAIAYWSTDYYTVGDVRAAAAGKTPKSHLAQVFLDTIESAPAYKGKVYRGIAMADEPTAALIGTKMKFQRPTSASKDLTVAQEFAGYGMDDYKVVYEIETDEGVDISKHVLDGYQEQAEVVLRGNREYEILGVELVKHPDGDYYRIKVKAVASEDTLGTATQLGPATTPTGPATIKWQASMTPEDAAAWAGPDGFTMQHLTTKANATAIAADGFALGAGKGIGGGALGNGIYLSPEGTQLSPATMKKLPANLTVMVKGGPMAGPEDFLAAKKALGITTPGGLMNATDAQRAAMTSYLQGQGFIGVSTGSEAVVFNPQNLVVVDPKAKPAAKLAPGELPPAKPKYTSELIGTLDAEDAEQDFLARQAAMDEFEAGPFNDGSEAAEMIKMALMDQGDTFILRDANGQIIGAMTYASDGNTIELRSIGSMKPGAGKQMIGILLDSAQYEGQAIELASVPGAVGFYEKLGFKKGKKQGSYTLFSADTATQKQIQQLLAQAADESPAMQVNHAEAAAKIAEILANPKGQTLKAKALQQLQKNEPDLTPSDMLAKAEGIAAEKQAAASKASVLSQAKKKLVAGEEPTPAQWKLLNDLPEDEKNAFLQTVEEGKKANAAGIYAELDALIDATKGNLAASEIEKLNLLPAEQVTFLNGKIIAAQQDATTATLMGKFGSLTELHQDAEASQQYAKLPLVLKNQIDDHLYAKYETKQAVDQIAAWKVSTDPLKVKAMKLAEEAAEGLTLPPTVIAQQAEQNLVHEEWNALAESVAGPNATKLKQAAFQKATGLKPDFSDLEAFKDWMADNVEPMEAGQILNTVTAEAAAKQAAASKASKLSTAKKKILEGKAPSPSEQATIDSLTPEEKAAWQEAVQQEQALKTANQPGLKIAVEETKLDSKKGLKALKAQTQIEDTQYADFLDYLEPDELAGYKLNALELDEYSPEWNAGELASLLSDTDKAKLPSQLTTIPLAKATTAQPYVKTADVEHYLKTGKTESDNPAHLGKPPLVIKLGGKFQVHDGNHRANAYKLAGETELPALVYDLDAAIAANPDDPALKPIFPDGIPPEILKAAKKHAGLTPTAPPAGPAPAPAQYTAEVVTKNGAAAVKNPAMALEQNANAAFQIGEALDAAKYTINGGKVYALKDPDNKLVAAISYGTTGSGQNLHIENVGSVAPGAGTQAMKLVIDDAAKTGKGITLNSEPEANGFYEKLGFKKVGKHDGLTAYKLTADEVKALKAGMEATPAPTVKPAKQTTQEQLLTLFDSSSTETKQKILDTLGLDMADADDLNSDIFKATLEALESDFSPEDFDTALKETKKLVKAAQKPAKAAKPAAGDTTASTIDLKAQNLDLAVPDPAGLTKLKDLSGSTRPALMEDPATGKKWVVKSPDQGGGGQPHLANEAAADQLYRIAGAAVPGSAYVETGGKPYKVAEFLEGAKTLGEWEKTATPTQKLEVQVKLQEHFVMDALLGNWDVAGQSNDNIMVMPDGTPVRVDNGGALDFRAMGAKKTKAEWTPEVTELKTMRDPSKAAGRTAQIFSGITTDEINRQIVQVVAKREALIEATTRLKGKATADMLAKRIDYLEKQLPAGMRKQTATEAAKAVKATAEAIPPTIEKDIKAARVNGVALPIGSAHVEDMQALTWTERDATGKQYTVTHLKVTDEGSAAIQAAIGQKLGTAQTVTAPQTGPIDDPYHGPWVSMAKTINTHKEDGQYNPGTTATFYEAKTKLEAELKALKAIKIKTAADKAKIDQAEHYLQLGKLIEDTYIKHSDAHAAGNKPKADWVPPYVDWIPFAVESYTPDKPPKAKATAPPAPAPDFTVTKKDKFGRNVAEIKKANATIKSKRQEWTVKAGVYELKFPDGTEVTYVPRTGHFGTQGRKQGLAFEGTVQVRLPADGDYDTVMRTVETLKKIGIDPTPAVADYKELVWLKKTAYQHNDQAAFDAAIANASTPAEKIAAGREFIEKAYKVKVPQRGEEGYTADGVPNSFGHGFRHVYRADITPQRIEAEMGDYALMHSPSHSMTMADVISAMLETGGEATPTTQRVRKGVDVDATGGWSSDSDIRSGGADYFFTRIRKKENLEGRHLAFKIRNLARADAVSYGGDYYGETGRRSGRKSKITDYKSLASKQGSDETVLKNGMFLLDELDLVVCRDANERKECLEAFKKHGITHMTDGRPIEDVVRVK